MPTVAENQQLWAADYDWTDQGEEWSRVWGGSEAQWFGAILPRIHGFLPARTVLEIAPGYGRWTEYLRHHAQHLIAVDLSEVCIASCRARFATDPRVECYTNDGTSLAMVDDGSVDFVFSFDSLVHSDADVLAAYLTQLGEKLAPNGVGFIHHSNVGTYQRYMRLCDAAHPQHPVRRGLRRVFGDNHHWRDRGMTAGRFEELCNSAGLQCIAQETVNWGEPRMLNDAFSSFARIGSRYARPNRRFRNYAFMREAAAIARLAFVYPSSPGRGSHAGR